jgi:tetratricopeptide (TPR) repeat protein
LSRSLRKRSGKYAEAADIAKRELAVAERQFGPDDAKVGATLNNLAALYRAQGCYAEAEPLFKRALAIAEKARRSASGQNAKGSWRANLVRSSTNCGHWSSRSLRLLRARKRHRRVRTDKEGRLVQEVP